MIKQASSKGEQKQQDSCSLKGENIPDVKEAQQNRVEFSKKEDNTVEELKTNEKINKGKLIIMKNQCCGHWQTVKNLKDDIDKFFVYLELGKGSNNDTVTSYEGDLLSLVDFVIK
jgi:hypothetical protein